MANELKHASPGAEAEYGDRELLTTREYEAFGAHVLNNQALGDLIYASSAAQLSRLGIGAEGSFLRVSAGVPSWGNSLPNGASYQVSSASSAPNMRMYGVTLGGDGEDVVFESVVTLRPFSTVRIAPLNETNPGGNGDRAELSLDTNTIANISAGNFARFFLWTSTTAGHGHKISTEKRGTGTLYPLIFTQWGRVTDVVEEEMGRWVQGDATTQPGWVFLKHIGIGGNISTAATGAVTSRIIFVDEDFTNPAESKVALWLGPAFTETVGANGNRITCLELDPVVRAANTQAWNNTFGLVGIRFAPDFSSTANVYTFSVLTAMLFVNAANMGSAVLTNQYGLYFNALTAGVNNYAIYINTPTGTIARAIHVVGGQIYFGGGVIIGADSTDGMIDDASNGAGSTQLYIGNKKILVGNAVNFGPAAVASITVVDGQITAIS